MTVNRHNGGTKTQIKLMVLRNPTISIDEIRRKLKEQGVTLSRLLVASIRTSFREDLQFLIDEGLLDFDLYASPPDTTDDEDDDADDYEDDDEYRRRNKFGPRSKPFKPWRFPG